MAAIIAQMPGKVVEINVKVGDEVKQGQELCVIEAMKMKMPVNSPQDGVVKEIKAEVGTSTRKGDVLVEID